MTAKHRQLLLISNEQKIKVFRVCFSIEKCFKMKQIMINVDKNNYINFKEKWKIGKYHQTNEVIEDK